MCNCAACPVALGAPCDFCEVVAIGTTCFHHDAVAEAKVGVA